MTDLISRLDELEPEFLERQEKLQPKIENNKDPELTGGFLTRMKSIKRFIALCDYKLRNNVTGFRENLKTASSLKKSLFDRHNKGEFIDDSFVSMNSLGHILDAFAAGDLQLGEDFARVIGGREELERYHDHPFDFAFGYALKAAILNHKTDLNHWLPIADKEVKRKDVKYFQAYVDALYALRDKDEKLFTQAMQQLVKDHRKMCRSGGIFENNDDEVLCFWGLGLINLARYQGLNVTMDDEFIPQELII